MNALARQIMDLERGRDLTDAAALMDALARTDDEDLIRALFFAWADKGISEADIYSLASLLRERCRKVVTNTTRVVDVVGSGGSSSKTFNVSTAAAFVIAGAGVRVAKHGNRAATSNSGSSDALSELGVATASAPEAAARDLDSTGICFLFAPLYHDLPPIVGKVRRSLGFPTVFNCVGPICNPAFVPHQLIGVWDVDIAERMARALARLGTNRSWMVHSENGLDEIDISGITHVFEVSDGAVRRSEISMSDFGLRGHPQAELPKVSTPAESAEIIRGVLSGRLAGSAAEALVLVNAAAALYICGHSDSLGHGLAAAVESLRAGHAAAKLDRLVTTAKER